MKRKSKAPRNRAAFLPTLLVAVRDGYRPDPSGAGLVPPFKATIEGESLLLLVRTETRGYEERTAAL